LVARVVLSFDDAIVKEVELSRPLTVVGRHPDCDVVIEHPAVSGRHMLFRVVNRTVYAEDLASTNGMRVNGLATGHQVLHHLDLIEVGRHKMHFFEDALLGGGLTSLEKTVLNDYERTMLAAHVEEAPRARGGEDLSRTMAIARDPAQSAPAAAGTRAALALRVLKGDRAGERIALEQANTMIGVAGGDSALVVKRGGAIYLVRFSGEEPRLNRRALGAGAHVIKAHDVIEVGRLSFEVVDAP
jgi:FHA domain-containing protein